MDEASEVTASYQCAHCEQRFARIDHLTRHVRTHTKEKPHRCATCGKRFARADLLRRHSWRHVSPEQRKLAAEGRESNLRASKACRACASAKLRCDDQRPCPRCVKRCLPCDKDDSDADAAFDSIGRQDAAISPAGTPQSEGVSLLLDQPDSHSARQHVQLQPQASSSIAVPSAMLDPRNGDMAFANGTNDPTAGQLDLHTSYDFNDSVGQGSLFYSDFLKDLLFTPSMSQQDNTRGIRTPDIWDTGQDMNFPFGDALVDVPFGDIPPLSDAMLFSAEQGTQALQNGQSPEQLALAAGEQAFSTSVWHWVPSPADHSAAEHSGLALPSDAIDQSDHPLALSSDILLKRLRPSHRDQVLAILLEQCDKEHIVKIATAFPSHPLMEKLMHATLHFQAIGTLPFLHIATFDLETVSYELLTCMVAYGAFLSPVSATQSLGTAMADIIFMVTSDRFTSNNATTRDLQMLQCYALYMHILFWSGNKRRTEIGESFIHPLITMLRRANRMDRHGYKTVLPRPSDTAEELNSKWRLWAEQECFIRLAHHVFLHDAHASMTLFTSPLMTASEMTLPFPAADALWKARDAQQWRDAYLDLNLDNTSFDTLSAQVYHQLGDGGTGVISPYHCPELSKRLMLTGLWHFVWLQQTLRSWCPSEDFSNSFQNSMSPVSFAALNRALTKYHVEATISSGGATRFAAESIISQYLMLALHAPLKTFPIFAGRDGENEARCVYPMLQEWAAGRESRRAIWSAGQILRHAKTLSRTQRQTFFAVAIYHASLTLWTFSLISSARSKKSGQIQIIPDDAANGLRLDDQATTEEVNEFVALGNRSPVISCGMVPLLFNPGAAMAAGVHALGLQPSTPSPWVPRFVESLVQLMDGLSNASRSLGFV